MKDMDNSVDAYKKTLEAYDKYGLQIKNADAAIPAEAAFYMGEYEYNKMTPVVLKGKEKEKAKIIKSLVEILQKAMGHYSKSAAYASEKWTFRATNKMGMLFVTMAAKIREQQLNGKKEEEKFAERIGIVQQLPTYYEQARPIFQKNIDLARDQGFYNKDVIAAEMGYIEMYYQGCAVFVEVADAFANSPLPDSAMIVREYIGQGMVKDDAIMAAHEDLEAYREELNSRSDAAKQDLEAYREELNSRSDAAKQLAIPQCATGIKASAHYGIENEWTTKLFETLRKLDESNEDLNTKIEKFDPSTLFADPAYFKLKARIEQIEQSDAMTLEEKVSTFRNIVKETKDDRVKLEEELAKLKQWMADPSLIPALKLFLNLLATKKLSKRPPRRARRAKKLSLKPRSPRKRLKKARRNSGKNYFTGNPSSWDSPILLGLRAIA